MHCKDCKYADASDTQLACLRAGSSDGVADDELSLCVARDYELYSAYLRVQPEFGCIQFEPKASELATGQNAQGE